MNISRAAQVETDPLGSRAAPPQPRSYAYQESPARPYCSNGVVFAPSANGSSVGGIGSGVDMKKPVMPCRGDSGVGGVVQPPMPGSADAVPGATTSAEPASSNTAASRRTRRTPGRWVVPAGELRLCSAARGRGTAGAEGFPAPARPASPSSARAVARATARAQAPGEPFTRSPGRR